MFENCSDVLTVDELRVVLQIGKNAAYSLLRSGELKHIRIGSSYRIPKPYLIEYVLK